MISTGHMTWTDRLRPFRDWLQLSPAARKAVLQESSLADAEDPGMDHAVSEAVHWLGRAQDRSSTADGGVARHFSLIDGWGPSYPETTGYIIPTIIHYAESRGDDELMQRARRMLDWLLAIQLPGGGFQGGTVTDRPVVPVTFNTGQILMGLAAGATSFGERYTQAMHDAARWLVSVQDEDGCWRKSESPFARPGDKTYDTHTAWGLLEAAKAANETAYADAALRNVRWAVGKQRPNGWFDDCCLTDPSAPLTHTLGYALRGVIEGYRYSGDEALLEAARRTGTGLLDAIDSEGFIPGRLDAEWRGTVGWSCLTGSVQIAHCWLQLFVDTGERPFLVAAQAANRYVRRTLDVEGPPETRGGVRGSFPVYGEYGQYQYLNWAAKFFIDSNLLEKSVPV